MQIAAAVRECISLIEADVGKNIDVQTISYNRMMNHIKYMAARAMTGEVLKLDLNEYMEQKFPASFQRSAILPCISSAFTRMKNKKELQRYGILP